MDTIKAKVLITFADYKEKRICTEGQEIVITEERLNELNSVSHKLLLKKISTQPKNNLKKYPKHIGGGWYLLSNGEKVQGKEKAKQVEREIGADSDG